MLISSVCLTMLCAVNSTSMRTSGSGGWSDGASAWVGWGFLGSGTVLCLLALAAVTGAGWFERLDPAWVARVALMAAVGMAARTSYDSWHHRRHLEETLMDGWTLHVAWGLAWAPWVAGFTAAVAATLLVVQAVGAWRHRWHARNRWTSSDAAAITS